MLETLEFIQRHWAIVVAIGSLNHQVKLLIEKEVNKE